MRYDDYVRRIKTKKIVKYLVSIFGSKTNLCREIGVSPQLLCKWERSNYPIKCPYPIRIYIASEKKVMPWEINPIEYPMHLMNVEMIPGAKINPRKPKKQKEEDDDV